MSNLRIKLDGKHLKLALQKMRKTIYEDDQLRNEMLRAQEGIVERQVKERLLAHSAADPSRTSSKNTGVVQEIQKNITSGFVHNKLISRFKNKIATYTGDVRFLDENDPITDLIKPVREPKSDDHKLWRILEWGQRAHLISPRTGKTLEFYFKKIGKVLETDKPIKHPGAQGRRYFFRQSDSILSKQVTYESDKAVIPRVMKALQKFVWKHSARRTT